MKSTHYAFDVAFSFASEQRPYIQKVYEFLSERGIRVFYDGGEVVSLWGKDLYQYLADIYSNKAHYCVVFLSREYAVKLWTRHELKFAQARAFKESEEYLLPARFDDTEIPGLLPAIGYINLNNLSPEDFSNLIIEKLEVSIVGRASQLAFDISPSLEARLADAVIFAEEYLQPQSLDLSDAIAEAVRTSFRQGDLKIDRRSLLPYLRSTSQAHRVTGYIAYQVESPRDMALDFITSLRLEKTEATTTRSTRPLWQLLVCLGLLLQIGAGPSEITVIKTKLAEFLAWMRTEPSIDPGGQCKQRIELLLKF